jgi:hypothetical protein
MEESGSKLTVPRRNGSGEALDWLIASGTCIQRHHGIGGKLCDFLSARNSSLPAYFAIELKSRVQHAKDIVEQIQAGASILSSDGDGRRDFHAVLVKSRGVSSNELRILKANKIHYRGVKYPIKVMNSGSCLPGS